MKYSFIFLNMLMQPNCTHEFVYMIRFTFTSAANVYTAMIKTQIHFPFHQQNLTRMLFAYTHLSFLRIFCCCHIEREPTKPSSISIYIVYRYICIEYEQSSANVRCDSPQIVRSAAAASARVRSCQCQRMCSKVTCMWHISDMPALINLMENG